MRTLPENERAGGEALRSLELMGSSQAPELDCIVALARQTFGVPIALVTLVDEDKLRFEAFEGIGFRSLDRGSALFSLAIASGRLVVLEDPRSDPRFSNDRLMAGDLAVRFFAAMPLSLEPGLHIGSLCILDTEPRHFTDEQAQALARMANIATAVLRQHRDAGTVVRMSEELETKERLVREQATSLAHSRKIFERASNAAKIGVWECDLDGEKLTWTNSVYDLFELPRQSSITREQTLEFYSDDSRQEMEALRSRAIREGTGFSLDAKITTAKGNPRWMRLTVNVEHENGVAARIFGMKQDITEEKTLWERTRFLAEVDVLTGLANRNLFQTRLSGLRENGGEAVPIGALLLIDLDGFKLVNDTFGHALGDECLKQVAGRLRGLCDDAEIVARIGGDEFAILIGAHFDRPSIEEFAERILEELRRPIQWRDQSFQLGASIGIAIQDGADGTDRSDLLANADIALYDAKGAGRNNYQIFVPEMKVERDQLIATVSKISKALSEEELELHYQPKVHLPDNSLAGFEALLRWRMPDGRVVPAHAFEAAFEDPELSTRIGQWVMENALRQAARWHQAGVDFGHIAVNLSSSQLRDHRFAESLIERIAGHGLLPEMIEVEVTEGVFLHDETGPVKKILERLKDSGIRVALDDFGTGYASLVHLRSYPIDVIKIDRSFVERFLSSPQDRVIMEAALALGLRLGMDVVAEGIETMAQLECLKALGCPMGQGYLFSKPIPASEASNWHMPAAVARPVETWTAVS